MKRTAGLSAIAWLVAAALGVPQARGPGPAGTATAPVLTAPPCAGPSTRGRPMAATRCGRCRKAAPRSLRRQWGSSSIPSADEG